MISELIAFWLMKGKLFKIESSELKTPGLLELSTTNCKKHQCKIYSGYQCPQCFSEEAKNNILNSLN